MLTTPKPALWRQFTEHLSWFFTNWEEFAQGLSWEMIYVQHADSTMISKWQRCGPVNPNNETDAEKIIVAFWDGKVHQYQFVLTRGFLSKVREMRTQRSWGKGIGKKVGEKLGNRVHFVLVKYIGSILTIFICVCLRGVDSECLSFQRAVVIGSATLTTPSFHFILFFPPEAHRHWRLLRTTGAA
ncbi:putative retrotransposon hot spot (RHS) protein [Trypanosoma cruzi]|uniref:Putative retrotransposon hot spot (RHS) protein n=1 Tax=Trypanosoma cruzi TaxID=5693 RepID=A0A2V2VDB2_TRYCR|nr:putative retrotransposon hot spot (RHS) protein [Trypanosoma cruzi]